MQPSKKKKKENQKKENLTAKSKLRSTKKRNHRAGERVLLQERSRNKGRAFVWNHQVICKKKKKQVVATARIW